MVDIWAIGCILYYLIKGVPLNESKTMQEYRRTVMMYRGINKGCTSRTKKDDSIKELVTADCFDFLSKLLHPIAAKRMSLYDAWLHPWISRFKKRILTISRPRAFESLRAIISYSMNTNKLF